MSPLALNATRSPRFTLTPESTHAWLASTRTPDVAVATVPAVPTAAAPGGVDRKICATSFELKSLLRYVYQTKNPLTFRDIDSTQYSTHPGVPINAVFGFGTPNEVHNMGDAGYSKSNRLWHSASLRS